MNYIYRLVYIMIYSNLFKISFVKSAGKTAGFLSVLTGFGLSLLVTTKTISGVNNTIKKIKLRKQQKKLEHENNIKNDNDDTCH